MTKIRELKDYQEKYSEKLKDTINEQLTFSESSIIVFKSPTGSGKTIMIAETLQRLVKLRTDKKEFAFVWLAVNKLHDQSFEKLESYYESTNILRCVHFEDLIDKKIEPNEIVFVNWASVNRPDNKIMNENETDFFLSKIIENTKSNGLEIVLIIDESHHTAESENSLRIINKIGPKITIEVSATPKIKANASVIIDVRQEEVINAGMIKKQIDINPKFASVEEGTRSTDEVIIDEALKKRKHLKEVFQKEGSVVNPLLLIQLPDSKAGALDRKEEIKSILKKQGVTTENGKLAMYLNDDKQNLDNIQIKDNPVNVLIFKQAIAIGWDCPRANILVILRDIKSEIFTIQTIGRIMRMPEFHHYKTEELNHGYIYTNIKEISIDEDIIKGYITFYSSKRISGYKPIELNSIHIERQRERTRLSSQFTEIFDEIAKKTRLKDKIDLERKPLLNEMMVDGKIVKLDIQKVEYKQTKIIAKQALELQYAFDLFVRSASSPFAPVDSSRIIKTATYGFFKDILKISNETDAQLLMLNQENNHHVLDTINLAKEEYKKKIVQNLPENRDIKHNVWEVPEEIRYGDNVTSKKYQKSIMQPFYVVKLSAPEESFISLLENEKNVDWWFKNGESEKKYFAIPYIDESGFPAAFYVDFILKLKTGELCLFDPKEGYTAEVAKEKAEGLQKYIENQQKKKLNVIGGIVIRRNGSWYLNANKDYKYSEKSLDGWEILNLSK